jgi:hypothetical protein
MKKAILWLFTTMLIWSAVSSAFALGECLDYKRDAAVQYAKDNWNSPPTYKSDCTNFVSQTLAASGLSGFSTAMCTVPGVHAGTGIILAL